MGMVSIEEKEEKLEIVPTEEKEEKLEIVPTEDKEEELEIVGIEEKEENLVSKEDHSEYYALKKESSVTLEEGAEFKLFLIGILLVFLAIFNWYFSSDGRTDQ